MLASLIIVDDFLDNPYEVREAALSLDYPVPEEKTYFPGRNSAQRIDITGVDRQVSRIVNEPMRATPGTGHGKFRIALSGDKGRGNVHIDPQCHWSGILYLTLPEHCRGGTDFFRHKPTGTDRAPITQAELEAMGLSDFNDVFEKIVFPQSNKMSKWEKQMRVPMRFNRLVLLRPWLWHTASPGFGNSLENGRLVHLMFFTSALPPS